MKMLKSGLVACAILLLSACGSDDNDDYNSGGAGYGDGTTETKNIAELASSTEDLSTLVTALDAAGLVDTLADESSMFTVFAPTNAAFAALPDGVLDGLLADTDALSGVLTYHVLGSKVEAAGAVAAAGNTVETVNGASIGLSLDGSNLLVNTATVTVTDIQASNGVVHIIDAVLLPPETATPTQTIADIAIGTDSLSTLVDALTAADLVSVVDDETASLTVFAPTNDAFAKIDSSLLDEILADTDVLTAILTQHVVESKIPSINAYAANGTSVATASGATIPVKINSATDTLTFGGATVTIADIQATNGVIHVIDTVVIADVELPEVPQTITSIASSNGSFDTLTAALEATGLDAVLDDASASFTVFAPTDDAFDALEEGVLEGLLADPDALKEILLYHVVAGDPVLSDAAVSLAQGENNVVSTENTAGDSFALSVVDGRLFVNTAEVTSADIQAENGVIHVIDKVLMPVSSADGSQTIAALAGATDSLSTLVSALTAANLVDTLSDEDATFTVFAPTNDAFDKIPDDTLAGLLADTDALSDVLLQHVVASEIDSVNAYAASGKQVTTAADNTLTVQLVDFKNAANGDNDAVAYDSSKGILVAGNGDTNAGFALYVFDSDLGSDGSECNDACATAWPPLLASDETTMSNIPGLSTVIRDNGDKQLAYLGRPLYFYQNDTVAGATNGDGVNEKWWLVELPAVSLQVMGSNVTTSDIKASNGVVHLIDTVIVEANE